MKTDAELKQDVMDEVILRMVKQLLALAVISLVVLLMACSSAHIR